MSITIKVNGIDVEAPTGDYAIDYNDYRLTKIPADCYNITYPNEVYCTNNVQLSLNFEDI